MEPVTHLLASYTLARAARTPVLSTRMAVFLCAGLAPDVDWFFHLPAPLPPVRAYGTAAHSLVGAGALAAGIAAVGWAAGRAIDRQKSKFGAALAAGSAAAALHLLLDLCSDSGIALFWPFRASRLAWNLAANFDVILVLLLGACALAPMLLSLITEEIGAGAEARQARAWPSGAGWPLAAMLLATTYLGGRAVMHSRAEELLGNAEYRGSAPRHWAAYPLGASPFTWRGVVETDTFLAEIEVPVGNGKPFDASRATARFKPEASPAFEAAAAAPLARAYAAIARFPSASLAQTAEGTRLELRELGDSVLRSAGGAWLASIQLDGQLKITGQDLDYLPAHAR